MLSGNGTIDYNVEAHTLDVQETSAARQGSTTRNMHGSITKNFQLWNAEKGPLRSLHMYKNRGLVKNGTGFKWGRENQFQRLSYH